MVLFQFPFSSLRVMTAAVRNKKTTCLPSSSVRVRVPLTAVWLASTWHLKSEFQFSFSVVGALMSLFLKSFNASTHESSQSDILQPFYVISASGLQIPRILG